MSSHRRRPRSHTTLTLASLATLQLTPLVAPAATPVTYSGLPTGLWSNPANWSTNTVPTNAPPDTFDVTIGDPVRRPTRVVFDLPNATIDNLTLTGLDPTLQITANHHLTLTGTIFTSTPATSLPTITVDAGSLSIPSPLSASSNAPSLQVTSGGHATWALPQYSVTTTSPRTLFSADGQGSLIDLSATATLDATVLAAPGSNPVLGIGASSGATIDLSNLLTASGFPDRDDGCLSFTAHSGGTLKLDRLAQTTGGVSLEGDLSLPSLTHMHRASLTARAATLNLPALTSADVRRLDIDGGGTINAPHLTTLTHADINLGGGTLNVPLLTTLTHAYISLGGGTLNTGTITSLDHSYLTVFWGDYAFPAVTSYNGPALRTFGTGSLSLPALTTIDLSQRQESSMISAEIGPVDLSNLTTAIGPGARPGAQDAWLQFSAYGGNLRLDSLANVSGNVEFLSASDGYPLRLPNLRSVSDNVYLHAYWGTLDLPNLHSVSQRARFHAHYNGGIINASSLSTVSGPPAGSPADPIRFTAEDTGTLHLGSLTQTAGRIAFEINTGGRVIAKDLWLGPDVSLATADSARLTVNGSFIYAPASHAQSTLDRAILEMTPAPGHTALLEAGVPIGRLAVGTPTQPAIVRVVDLYPSNGSTAPQALYLTGTSLLDFTGLELHPGSILDLGGVDVYATIMRDVIHLNALFGPGQTEIPWHGGTLRNTPFSPLPGDTAPFDGVVDLADLNHVLSHFGATTPTPGDTAPFDARVDLTDLNNVLNNLSPADHAAALSLIPEPSSFSLLATGYWLLSTRFPRHRRRSNQKSTPITRYQIITLLSLAAAASSAPAVPHYALTDLGEFTPVDLNNAGQILGVASPPSPPGGAPQIVLSSTGGTLTPLVKPDHLSLWYPRALNDRGDIVGRADLQPFPNQLTEAFLFRDDQYLPLGLPHYSEARGINNAGQIAAFGGDPETGPDRAYLIHAPPAQPVGQPLDLGSLPGNLNAWALAVNNAGHVAGVCFGAGPGGAAALFAGGTVTPLGTLPAYASSFPTAINDADQIVGHCSNSGSNLQRAFLYDNGALIDLGALPGSSSTANDINAAGLIVGASGDHAVLFADAQVLDLNTLIPLTPGWVLQDALAINDAGNILCAAYALPGGPTHAFLLTPSAPLLPGDTAPFDGVVDLTDLNHVLAHFGDTSPTPGDTTPFDGVVDLHDLNNVLNHLSPTDHAAALSLIPEPSTWACLLAGLLFLRRSRSKREF